MSRPDRRLSVTIAPAGAAADRPGKADAEPHCGARRQADPFEPGSQVVVGLELGTGFVPRDAHILGADDDDRHAIVDACRGDPDEGCWGFDVETDELLRNGGRLERR